MFIRNPAQITQARLWIIFLIVSAAIGTLLFNLYRLQIHEGYKYSSSVKDQTTISILLPPARGSIYDHNGLALAENKASLDLDLYLRELVGYYSRSHKGKLPRAQWEIGAGSRRRMHEGVDASKIVSDSAGDLLQSLKVDQAFTPEELRQHYFKTPNAPFILARNLDFTTLSKFSEKGLSVPGIRETARPVRYYNFGALAPHILGYLGAPNEESDQEYQPDFIGKDGVERSMDEFLQGIPGMRILRKNYVGFILGEDSIQQPTSGNSVYLTIDARIQWIVEEVLRRRGVGRSAVVVLDPRNGDVLAMASVPNYDPNDFVPRIDSKTWSQLTKDPTHPLFNRALGTYAAGSIFKPLIALAALSNPKANFTAQTVIDSPGAIYAANRWWKDWNPNGQGPITLRMGLAMSCNTFFYQLGLRTGITSIVQMGKRVGLGDKLLTLDGENPVLYGESSGVMPGPEWMEAINDRKMERWKEERNKTGNKKLPRPLLEHWSDGHTINTSIGQGYVQVTPLQMATMTSAIANGGTIYYPRLVVGVGRLKDGVNETVKEYPARIRGDLEMEPAKINAVRDGMRAVVEEGTGRKAEVSSDFKVAGKTGTAQFETTLFGRRVKDLKTWFTGFAPYDSPRYVITVLVEGGVSGGSSAAPIVSDVLRAISEMEKGKTIDMAYLSPAIGHFAGVKDSTPTPVQSTPTDSSSPPPEDSNEPDARPQQPQAPAPGTIQRVRGLR